MDHEKVSHVKMSVSRKNKFALHKPIQKLIFTRYSPKSLATVNNNYPNRFISLLREDPYICQQNFYFGLEFRELKIDNTRYANNDQISLVIFGPVALFSEAKLTTASGKHLENVENLHTISLLYNCSTSNQQTNEL